MAALHSALQSLGPCKFGEIPSSLTELEFYLEDLFKQSQLILESIPIPPPDEKFETRPRSNTTTSIASNSSEISSSSARSAPPIPEHAALQKEWGKPVNKLGTKDNPLNMAVYKLGGKDGRGAWFARRSVHDGLGFAKFKKALEMEFPTSLAVQGAPGEGNIRGIGGDKKLEDISVPGKGRVEVYQLSAQFPGPTTPRDFVTLLVTSSNAMKMNDDDGRSDQTPRHFMIISKPCDHPETQARDGYVRGNYESVEFIREIPRLPKRTMSSVDLSKLGSGKGRTLEKEALLRSAERKSQNNPLLMSHENKSLGDLNAVLKANQEGGRKRGKTISFSESIADDLRTDEGSPQYDPETNPVEWIMVTRSDPGGSVPRFMVERGTPGSIVADASKFLDWACQYETGHSDRKHDSKIDVEDHKDGLAEVSGIDGDTSKEWVPSERSSTTPSLSQSQTGSLGQSGILSNMTAGLEAYTPQMILDYLSAHTPKGSEATTVGTSTTFDPKADLDDSADSLSTTSFASADSHLEAEPQDYSNKPPSKKSKENSKEKAKATHLTQHEKELAKLTSRRQALDSKLASVREKSVKDSASLSQKEKESLRKAEERHAREINKQEEKYRREIEKIEQRRKREEKRIEERKRKEEDRDEKKKLERERDEARKELERLKKESEMWKKQVGDLQKENTALVARTGKLEKELKELKAEKEKGGETKNTMTAGNDNGSNGNGTAGGKEKETLLQPIVMDADVLKNLLRDENKQGLPDAGNMARGVSVNGAASLSGGDSSSAPSRGSSLLQRGVSLGTVGMASAGGGSGTSKQHDM